MRKNQFLCVFSSHVVTENCKTINALRNLLKLVTYTYYVTIKNSLTVIVTKAKFILRKTNSELVHQQKNSSSKLDSWFQLERPLWFWKSIVQRREQVKYFPSFFIINGKNNFIFFHNLFLQQNLPNQVLYVFYLDQFRLVNSKLVSWFLYLFHEANRLL